eukprot:765035-Hanusia_phi.AAC.6
MEEQGSARWWHAHSQGLGDAGSPSKPIDVNQCKGFKHVLAPNEAYLVDQGNVQQLNCLCLTHLSSESCRMAGLK